MDNPHLQSFSMIKTFRFQCIAIALLASSLVLLGQGTTRFEVASIKPAGPLTGDLTLGLRADGAQAHITWASVKDLIWIGYHVKRYQISGPDWLGIDHFDVAAKIPEGVSQRVITEMMQNLLKDRFGMKAHWEKKEFSAYTLQLSKRYRRETASPANASNPFMNDTGPDAVPPPASTSRDDRIADRFDPCPIRT